MIEGAVKFDMIERATDCYMKKTTTDFDRTRPVGESKTVVRAVKFFTKETATTELDRIEAAYDCGR